MRNCYLSRNYKGVDGAGNKAKTDIERIMAENGFVNVGFRQTRYTNSVLAFLATLAGVIEGPFLVEKGRPAGVAVSVEKIFHVCMPYGSFPGSESGGCDP